MNIRPHHLWVLRGIIKRYGAVTQIQEVTSQERQSWKELYLTLKQNLDSKVTIVDSLDYICMRCSNSNGITCLKYIRLNDVDNEAIVEFGLKYNVQYPVKDIIEKLAGKNFARTLIPRKIL